MVTLRAQYCLATMLRLMYQVSRQIADSQKYRATSFNACGHLAIKISRGEVPDHVQKPAAALEDSIYVTNNSLQHAHNIGRIHICL